MSLSYTYFLFFLSIILCPRAIQAVDQEYAAKVVKDALSLPGTVTAQVLKGGNSGAQLFTVTSDSKKYVIRFLHRKKKYYREQEINCLKIASREGYGPHIYYANIDQGVVIMDFLVRQNISFEQRTSDRFYKSLAHLLQKIHRGKKYKEKRTVFNTIQDIRRQMRSIKSHCNEHVPLVKLEHILDAVYHALPCSMYTSCHNDLHPNNVMFLGNDFKAVDYEVAALSDPHFDIATVTLFYCIDHEYEKVLLETYFDRQPSLQENARLYLIKQATLIMYAIRSLGSVTGMLNTYEQLQVPFYDGWNDFLKKFLQERAKGNLRNRAYNLTFAKVLINRVIANFESCEFKNAVSVIAQTKSVDNHSH
ncbi:MAG: phosphotransferase [bacterium]